MSSFTNPIASYSSDAFTPDRLVLGGNPLGKKVTILTGENLVRGAVIGSVSLGTATDAVKSGGNTGNGTLTLGTPAVLANAQTGVYAVRCIAAAVDGGTFRVTDPQGNVLGDVDVGVAFANQVSFTIADGASDFVVGDGFDITVAPGSGKYKLSATAATDGSNVPDLVLAHDVDATAEDKEAMAYYAGHFNANAVTLGTGHTVASTLEGLRLKGIHLITPVSA